MNELTKKRTTTQKPPLPKVSETTLVTNTINTLRWLIPDGMFWRNNSGMITTQKGAAVKLAPAGTADIVGILSPGFFIALEAKVPTRRSNVSDKQKRWMTTVQSLGGYACVFCTVDEALNHVQQARLFFSQRIISLADAHNSSRSSTNSECSESSKEPSKNDN
jgi:hypothetical protein